MRLATALVLLALLVPDVAVAQSSAYIYISSRNTSSVKRYRADTGAYVDEFVESGAGGLLHPQEVLWAPDGNLLVTGHGNSAVKKYDGQSGTYLGDFTSGYQLSRPTKAAFGPDGYLYVSQWGAGQPEVARFDGATGVFVDEVTANGSDVAPMGQAWDSQVRLHVVTFAAGELRRYDEDGSFEVLISGLSGPVNVWLGDSNQAYIVEWGTSTRGSGRVVEYNLETRGFTRVVAEGLQHAEGWTFGPEDELLYVCDWTANAVYRYDFATGERQGKFIAGAGLDTPNSIVFGPPTGPVGVESSHRLERFQVGAVFPNPANGSASIPVQVARPGLVEIAVFDVLGRPLGGNRSHHVSVGSQELLVETAGLPVGVYLVALEFGDLRWARRVVIGR
ncbi:MAG: T9SS type A sorting domain-containing protein [Rhodothermales bacterium]|nr:T9SS type A sorting domain-containing protein [Rhodothermales bacterium]MBO6778066.1 T9SS type A sorting domain-containing protein [Rhodothermales bacterium]